MRVVLREDGVKTEAHDYYAFGLKMTGRSYGGAHKEGFTGKERDLETGWDYFGARYYIASIGRWNGVDALADQYPSSSPFAYVSNNPLSIIDPDGMQECEMNAAGCASDTRNCSVLACNYASVTLMGNEGAVGGASAEGGGSPSGWVRTADNRVIYDSRVTNPATATEHYGKDAVYLPTGYTYTSEKGQRVVLGEENNFKINGAEKIANDHSLLKQLENQVSTVDKFATFTEAGARGIGALTYNGRFWISSTYPFIKSQDVLSIAYASEKYDRGEFSLGLAGIGDTPLAKTMRRIGNVGMVAGYAEPTLKLFNARTAEDKLVAVDMYVQTTVSSGLMLAPHPLPRGAGVALSLDTDSAITTGIRHNYQRGSWAVGRGLVPNY